jgi:hypothetical protein
MRVEHVQDHAASRETLFEPMIAEGRAETKMRKDLRAQDLKTVLGGIRVVRDQAPGAGGTPVCGRGREIRHGLADRSCGHEMAGEPVAPVTVVHLLLGAGQQRQPDLLADLEFRPQHREPSHWG